MIDIKDLGLYYSAPSARSGMSTPGEADTSLGYFVSNTKVKMGLMNLFPNVKGKENSAGVEDYRCVFLVNHHPTLTLFEAEAWLEPVRSGGFDLTLGKDARGSSPLEVTYPQAARVTSSTQPPLGVEFVNGNVPLGNIPPKSAVALWIKRKGIDVLPKEYDGFVLHVTGDTLD